jgi:UDP-perosamine 4-acetyltransferase
MPRFYRDDLLNYDLMIPIVGIGAGGHAKVVLEILRHDAHYRLAGLLDRNSELWGKQISGIPVLGGDDLLENIFTKGIRHAFLGIGTTGNTAVRQQLYEKATQIGFLFIQTIHLNAIVSPTVKIGCGVTIMAGAIINADAHIGNNVIINTGAVVEHDCVIGDHSHVATGALLAGGVSMGFGSHVGVGASVRQNIRIGSNSIVGAGATVVKNVPDRTIVAGVPARFMKVAI